MSVGAPTYRPGKTAVNDGNWLAVRRDGKLLFEYNPENGAIRLRRWGRTFVVDLAPLQGQTPIHDARLKQ